jgi:tRNA modification GTPase
VKDTIFARITGAGRAAVAVVRVSGPSTRTMLGHLVGAVPQPRLAAIRRLSASNGRVLDQALVLWMPAPNSFTGEDCAELHVHGGRAVVDGLAEALTALGARPAQPGEFSRRAFENGKLDLLQAEAVADLVDAETEAQRTQALAQLSGSASRRYTGWRAELVKALALIEAEIDFPDEDLPGALAEQARPTLQSLSDDFDAALRDATRGQRVRDGYQIAIIGAPNAGKSSLFNALLERDAAIVSEHAGTTRDVIEAQLRVEGFLVTIADTAGVRITDDEVEAEGVRRARAWASRASLRIALLEPDTAALPVWVEETLTSGDILVLAKADLTRTRAQDPSAWAEERRLTTVRASTVSSGGLEALLGELRSRVLRDLGAAEQPLVTRVRHEHALRAAAASLSRALSMLDVSPEAAAEDVRLTAGALSGLVGSVDREAVLDQVFSSFCIGK